MPQQVHDLDLDFLRPGLLTTIKFGGPKLVRIVRQELELMEKALLDSCENHHFLLYEIVGRKVAIHKIQRIWRHRIKVRVVSSPWWRVED